MPETLGILVVDDHPIFRAGLVQLLAMEPSFSVLAQGGSAAAAIELAKVHQPDVLLLDLSMGDNGLDAIEPIRAASAETRVVVLTASDAVSDIETALDRGVAGYMLKGATGGEILEAIRIVASGQIFVSPRALSRMVMASRKDGSVGTPALQTLSARERSVLDLVGDGLSNREISLRLGIGEKSVKFHITNIFSKLGVRNRVQAAMILRNARKE